MSRKLLIFKQTLKKEFIKMLWGLLMALLTGIIFYFGATIGLKKAIEQVGKPVNTNSVHRR